MDTSNLQFGFQENRSTSLAKIKIAMIAEKKNLKKALLIDLRKAYDLVNLDKLDSMLVQLGEEGKLICRFIKIWKLLTYNVLDTTIFPNSGCIQGDPLSCVAFLFYIMPTLRNVKNEFQEIELTAFCDDITIQGSDINIIEKAYFKINEKLQSLDLTINENKTELLSEDMNDKINGYTRIIQVKTETKYLGQIINFKGKAVFTLKHESFGMVMGYLKNSSISRFSRIRIFQIYYRSKITHLLPLLILSDEIKNTWALIRNKIYNFVLMRDNTPKEALSSVKLGYYSFIIRPLIKLLENPYYDQFSEEKIFIIENSKKAFKYWLEAEQNIGDKLKISIGDFINSQNYDMGKVEYWDNLVNEDAKYRLYRGIQNIMNPLSINLPCTLLYVSNAKAHELESRIDILRNKVESISNREKEEIKKIIKKYALCIEYIENYEDKPLNNIVVNWENAIEEYELREIELKKRLYGLQFWKNYVVETFQKLMSEEKQEGNEINSRLKYITIIEMLNLFRRKLPYVKKEILRDIELILDEDDIIGEDDVKYTIVEKLKPGRPKKLNINSNNHLIDKFLQKIKK